MPSSFGGQSRRKRGWWPTRGTLRFRETLSGPKTRFCLRGAERQGDVESAVDWEESRESAMSHVKSLLDDGGFVFDAEAHGAFQVVFSTVGGPFDLFR